MSLLFTKLKHNWRSGVTVSLVSIPLSISLAVASGSTPVVGIITAIWGGLIASIFGGSNFNVVGPTGALSGLIATYAITHGMASLPMLAIVSGIMIVLAYIARLERYLIFIPSSVIHGFTLGVALIIGFNQFNYAFGLYGLQKHEKFFMNLVESFRHVPQTSLPTLAVFLVFFACLFAMRKFVPKIPGALLLSPLGIALGYLSATNIIPLKIATLQTVFGNLKFTLVQLPHFTFSMALVASSAAIALVAILETMLSAKIADGMTHTKSNERKEMFGLGLANIVSGLAGGLPATAALARTSLNIKTGATNKLSATISSLCIAIVSAVLLVYFKFIPMAVIAAILAFVAVQMIEKEHILRFYKYEKSAFGIMLLVAGITFYEDPIFGLIAGTALALLLFLDKVSRGHFKIIFNQFEKGHVNELSGDKLKEIQEDTDVLLYSISGQLAYLNSRAHVARFEQNLAKYKTIILRLREVYFIDLDGAEALDEIIEIVQKRGQQVILTSMNSNVESFLKEVSPHYRSLAAQHLVFPKTTQALAHTGIRTATT